MRIVIVEDEKKLADVLAAYLAREGFETNIIADGQQALDALIDDPPDLVLLDLMLPTLDGMSVCRELRRRSSVPVIMVTARVEEIDRLIGLEIGADDYICKPFSPREVVARAKAVLRRTNPQHDTVDNSAFRLDVDAASVHINGQDVSLTLVELELLKALSARPGQILSRSQLMTRIYPDNRVVSNRTIDSHVKKLRQKLRAVSDDRDHVHSVYGIGYKFEIPTSDDAGSEP